MTETEYIAITNRVKVSAAIYIIKDILPDYDGITTCGERTEILRILWEWEDKLFAKIVLEGE